MGRFVVLLRHPPVFMRKDMCYGGCLDVPLLPRWEQDVPRVASTLKQHAPVSMWSSPAGRCQEYAARLAFALEYETKAFVDLRLDARLAELRFGAWEGRAWADLPQDELTEWARKPYDFAFPQGEDIQGFLARVRGCWADIVRQSPGTIVIVSHGGPLKVISALARGEAVVLMRSSLPLGGMDVITPAPEVS